MKISELMTQEEKEQDPGTFAGVRFSKPSQDNIKKFCEQNDIPNGLPREKMHVTLLYSKKPCPNYEPDQSPYPMSALIDDFEVWTSEHIEGKPKCLVAKLKCKELEDRHHALMDEHEATFDYPEYKPHMTFSYDIEDLDVSPENLKKMLIEFPSGKVDLEREYREDLKKEYKADDLTKPHPGGD